jgi:hypothetical protein
MVAITPAAPAAPTLIAATATTLSLNLYIPKDNGGSPLTEFELYIKDGDDSNVPTTLITIGNKFLMDKINSLITIV